MQSEREYFRGMSSHRAVLARYSLRSERASAEDRECEQRQQKSPAAGAGPCGSGAGRSRFGATHSEIVQGFTDMCAVTDARDEARRRSDADERALLR